MKRKLIRITFIGDIMCERPLLKAYFINKGYDFRPVFEATKKLFNESDFVIGNLKTCFDWKEVGYTILYILLIRRMNSRCVKRIRYRFVPYSE